MEFISSGINFSSHSTAVKYDTLDQESSLFNFLCFSYSPLSLVVTSLLFSRCNGIPFRNTLGMELPFFGILLFFHSLPAAVEYPFFISRD
jgi:hypothetical protein